MPLMCAISEAMALSLTLLAAWAALQPEAVPACTKLLWEAVPACAV